MQISTDNITIDIGDIGVPLNEYKVHLLNSRFKKFTKDEYIEIGCAMLQQAEIIYQRNITISLTK